LVCFCHLVNGVLLCKSTYFLNIRQIALDVLFSAYSPDYAAECANLWICIRSKKIWIGFISQKPKSEDFNPTWRSQRLAMWGKCGRIDARVMQLFTLSGYRNRINFLVSFTPPNCNILKYIPLVKFEALNSIL